MFLLDLGFRFWTIWTDRDENGNKETLEKASLGSLDLSDQNDDFWCYTTKRWEPPKESRNYRD